MYIVFFLYLIDFKLILNSLSSTFIIKLVLKIQFKKGRPLGTAVV